MVRLALRTVDCGGRWAWDTTGRWTSGTSWVEPFANPAIETEAATDGRRTVLVVRERTTGSHAVGDPPAVRLVDPAGYERCLAGVREWPLEYLAVEAGPDGYRLHAGVWGSAPLYLTGDGSGVRGSWQLVDLTRGMTVGDLDEVQVVGHLAGLQRYRAETLFKSAVRVTERATAVVGEDGLKLLLPEPAPQALPRRLQRGADPVAAYEEILAAVVSRCGAPQQVWAVEVSGGLDSANVALTADAVVDGAVHTYGLLVGGDAGMQQQQRRAQLLALGAFDDLCLPTLSPFAPPGRGGEPYDPGEEPYREALDAILAEVAARGVRVVLTGVGGDELMAVPRSQDGPGSDQVLPVWLTAKARQLLAGAEPDGHPASVVCEPSVMAAACRAPLFLRRGLWPVNPLCAPQLIRFCEWLPVTWKAGRRLHRQRLRAAGLGEDWLFPPLRETFVPVMRVGLARHGLPALRRLGDLLLADLGLVDPAEAWDELERHGPDAAGCYELVNLELALRSLLD